MNIFDRLVWFSFTVLFFSYDGDRYDRGCVISIHHAIQIGFYIPAAETISITTDFKMAPAASMPLLKWLEETKFSEDITDTILALTILTKNAKKEFFIERIKVKENNEVRKIMHWNRKNGGENRLIGILGTKAGHGRSQRGTMLL